MCPHLLLLEPLSECMFLGAATAWAVFFLFRWDPLSFFLVHVLVWFLMDWALLHIVQVSSERKDANVAHRANVRRKPLS